MTEKVLPAIIGLLRFYHSRLAWHHCADSRLCDGPSGLPDLIIVGRHGALFAEVKPHPGSTLRPGQTTWKHMILAAGHRHVIWTQADLDSGKVRSDLDSIA